MGVLPRGVLTAGGDGSPEKGPLLPGVGRESVKTTWERRFQSLRCEGEVSEEKEGKAEDSHQREQHVCRDTTGPFCYQDEG